MKFELWVDATELDSFGVGATEIRGYEFDINWNDTEVGALNFSSITGDNVGFNASNIFNAAITFNSTNGQVAFANSTAVVATDATNDGLPLFIGTEQLIGTFYLNPNTDLETMSLSIDNMMIVTDTNNIYPTNYTTVLEISSVDATIQTDTNNYLDNLSLNFFKDGVDTGIATLVEGGDITFPATSLAFDVVKLSDTTAYTDGIAADDAVDVLRDIVHLDSLIVGSAAWHSADVNNDGVIAADDAVDILRHIVQLDTIDTFDLIDNTTGNRISSLDANAIDVGQWSIVANGDVDQSGGFGDSYTLGTNFETPSPNDIAVEMPSPNDIAVEMVLFQQTLALFEESTSIFDEQGLPNQTILVGYSPVVNFTKLGYGDLANALTIKPTFYTETSLGVNLYYSNGLTYFIEDQQGVYGSIGLYGANGIESVLPKDYQPLDIDQLFSEISTGPINYYEIDRLGDDLELNADFATMMLSNGFSTEFAVVDWVYVLDNADADTLAATVDLTHIDSFIISVTNGIDIESQQVDINIFEDIGLPFDLNTSLGRFQESFVNIDTGEDLTTTFVDIV